MVNKSLSEGTVVVVIVVVVLVVVLAYHIQFWSKNGYVKLFEGTVVVDDYGGKCGSTWRKRLQLPGIFPLDIIQIISFKV